MRRGSASTRGRPGGRSTTTACRPPAPANAVRDRSTSPASSRASGSTGITPGADAPGVEEVADQPVHAVGLLADNAQELAQLRAVGVAGPLERGGGRALDRGQRRAQLVAGGLPRGHGGGAAGHLTADVWGSNLFPSKWSVRE